MLVFISDLHFTDGTTGKSMPAGAFDMFRERVRDLAYDASWRSDGSYKPIETLDLVLLGDILDIIRSTKWTDHLSVARPWDNPENPALIRKIDEVVDAILIYNEAAFQLIKSLHALTLPRSNGKGGASRTRDPLTVRIHYMVGNHDWMLHLPGKEYGKIRQKIIDALGLANSADPFPHDPGESALLTEIFAQHQVMARHGDIYDPFNYPSNGDMIGRNAASLGDAIVIELINRFPHMVENWFIQNRPANVDGEFLTGLKELANVRPSLVVPIWINSLINRHKLDPDTANAVKDIWNKVADDVMKLPFIREQDTWSPFDAVDIMETVLSFSKIMSFGSIADILFWVQEKIWGGDVSFAKHALTEPAFKDRSAKFFVYGHTHHQEMVPLDVTFNETTPFEQIYFNSGTWHPLHEGILDNTPREARFVQYKVLTYLSFFKGDERKARAYDTWSGMLDD